MLGGGEVGDDTCPVKLAVPAVDLGNLGGEFIAVALGQTAHYRNVADKALRLGLCALQYHVDGLLFGVADKAAGVDDNMVGDDVVGIMHDRVADVLEHTLDTLGIDKVLRAAHCNQGKLFVMHICVADVSCPT